MRRLFCLFLTNALAVAIWSRTAGAQQPAATVQFPVVNQFGVATALSVPDRGAKMAGGMTSAASGSTQPGPLPVGAASGDSISAGNIQVRAFVHDFAAMDAELLRAGQESANRRVPLLPRAANTDRWQRQLPRASARQPDVTTRFPTESAAERDHALQILRKRR